MTEALKWACRLKSGFDMAAVETIALSKAYQGTQALEDITIEVKEGSIYGLIGPDGAGKTTLIRILASLIYPDSGRAKVLELDPVEEYKLLRKKLGYMPGRFSLYQDLTVEENLTLFASIYNTTIQANYHLVEDIYVQLEPFKKRKAGQLSGGMKQKLALSCAMIHEPEILFLDEPTTGVDPVSRKEFWEMLHKLNRQGLTIVVSTPYMDEARKCDEVALIQKGCILAVDSPEGITKLHNKPLYAVTGARIYDIMKVIREFPGFYSAYSFGSELHYCDHRKSFDGSELERFLMSKGFDITVEKIEPTIEDTFISLMGQENV